MAAERLLPKLESLHFLPVSTYIDLLRLYGNAKLLAQTKDLHSLLLADGLLDGHKALGNRLIQSYIQCGSIEDAKVVFKTMPERDLMSWTLLIAANARNGNHTDAMKLFRQLQLQGEKPDPTTFSAILTVLTVSEFMKLAHLCTAEAGFQHNVFVSTALITMYGTSGSLEAAEALFDELEEKTVPAWNAMIGCYRKNNLSDRALTLFRRMQLQGAGSNKITFVSVISACQSLEEGFGLHAWTVERGLEQDVIVGSSLVNMYGKLAYLHGARRTFSRVSHEDITPWNALLFAYAEQGDSGSACSVLRRLLQESLRPTGVTVLTVLSSCMVPEDGRFVHRLAAEAGIDSDPVVTTALINMYGRCGCLAEAEKLFGRVCHQPDVVLWSAMLEACTNAGGSFELVVELFSRMQLEGVKPNVVTFVSVLTACGDYGKLQQGKVLHNMVNQQSLHGLSTSNVTFGTCLVDMYGKCGSVEQSETVFRLMPELNSVTWNSMLATYALSGQLTEVRLLFHEMLSSGVRPDNVTLATMLNAWTEAGRIAPSSTLSLVRESGSESDVLVGTSLVNMFGRRNHLTKMSTSFDRIHNPNVFTWNALLSAYSVYRLERETLTCYNHMQLQGVAPNLATFVEVIGACGSLSALETGRAVHRRAACEMNPVLASVLIDMYSNCGAPEEALLVFGNISHPDDPAWNSVVAACAEHFELSRALVLFQQMNQLGCETLERTVFGLVRACVHVGLVERGSQLVSDYQLACEEERIKKNKRVEEFDGGRSAIEVKGRVYEFFATSRAACMEEVEAVLSRMVSMASESGVHVQLSYVKNQTEMVALGFGLLSTLANSELKISKSARMSIRCHSLAKFISKVLQRRIFIRDCEWFHHFNTDGRCSCEVIK